MQCRPDDSEPRQACTDADPRDRPCKTEERRESCRASQKLDTSSQIITPQRSSY